MMLRNPLIILIAGLIFLVGGVGILAGHYLTGDGASIGSSKAYAQLREADEYLRQNSDDASREAVTIFNRVLSWDVSPRVNHLARYGLGVALEKRQDQQAALEHYRILKQARLENIELADKVDYSLGKLYLYINHEEDARALLEPLLARSKNKRLKSRVHTAFGNFFLRRGERTRAADNFRVALKYDSENLMAEVGKAEAKQGGRNRWLSYEYYDDYLIGNANLNPAGKEKLVRELRQDAYRAGIVAYRTGEFRQAHGYFTRVLADGPEDAMREKAAYWLAESLQGMGDMPGAYAAYEQVLKNARSEMDQPALIKKGIILFNQNKLEAAARDFQNAIDHYPGGAYTERAIEWKREIRAQLRERELLERYRD